MYVDSLHDNWDEIADFAAFGYNTSRHESTAILPVDAVLYSSPNLVDEGGSAGAVVQNLVERLATVREIVKRRMIVVQAKQKQRYDRERREVNYRVNDKVLIFRPIGKKGRSEKLFRRYHGPYRIVKQTSAQTYQVESLRRGKLFSDVVHVDKLKPFHERTFPVRSSEQTSERI